ncbi:MAG: hypothetical protein L0G71_07700, partial [Yaniella sp.]|nr:hypothetical protein [Yaniella sp.]
MFQDIGFDVAERRFWAVLETIRKGSKNLVLKIRTWVCFYDRLSLLSGDRVISDAQYVEFYTASNQRDLGI